MTVTRPRPVTRRVTRGTFRGGPRTVHQVSCVPWDDPEAHHWTITVEPRGGDLWAVTNHGECLSVDDEWVYEPRPSERSESWIAGHRFELQDALRRAKQQAPRIEVNGVTAGDLARIRERDGVPGRSGR